MILLLPHSQRNTGFGLKMSEDRQKGEEMPNPHFSLLSLKLELLYSAHNTSKFSFISEMCFHFQREVGTPKGYRTSRDSTGPPHVE